MVNFLETINGRFDGFAQLTDLACRNEGQCYSDIVKAVEHCEANLADEGCMGYVKCE